MKQGTCETFSFKERVASEQKGQACKARGASKHERLTGKACAARQPRVVFNSKARTANKWKGPPLRELDPITIIELEFGEPYFDCALFGTVCNPPEVVDGMLHMSMKDQFGMQLHVSMHFNQDSRLDALNLKKAYTLGQHIAIKNPCLQRTWIDNASFIVLWDPQGSIVKLEKLPSLDPEKLLLDAHMYVVAERWELALRYLTKCINMLQEQKDSFDKPKKKANEASHALVDAFSTRAKVFYYTNQFEEALCDCNEALKVDPYHCKSLYRKGLALECLFHFEEACVWLKVAANRNAGKGKTKRKKKIRAILRSCRTCCRDKQIGKYADLARYLLHSYNFENVGVTVPSFPNQVGHDVEVKLLGGGKGRGMFASSDVKAGDVLLVSNAMAIRYQREGFAQNVSIFETECDDLVCEVESMANLQHVLSYMVGSGSPNASCTPTLIALGESYVLPSAVNSSSNLHMAKECIRKIVQLNAFGTHHFCQLLARHEYAHKYLDTRAYLGLWFLPSFINHSCVSNASRLVVGEAMFVHAARDINAGEEITLPYFDTLMPLKQRNAAMKRWEFRCNCRRCAFEQTLQTPLSNVSENFEHVYKWITETIVKSISAKGLYDRSLDLPMSKECKDMRSELGDVMLSTPVSIVDNEKHKWMMASYGSLLWFHLLPEVSNASPDPEAVDFLEKLAEAMHFAVPGHIRGLVVIGTVNMSRRKGVLGGAAMAICKSVFGAQEPHVVAELVRLYASVVPFP